MPSDLTPERESERFEKWLKEYFARIYHCPPKRDDEDLTWAAWQAASADRDAALEMAAQRCETIADNLDRLTGWNNMQKADAARRCAREIRSLCLALTKEGTTNALERRVLEARLGQIADILHPFDLEDASVDSNPVLRRLLAVQAELCLALTKEAAQLAALDAQKGRKDGE